MSDSEKQNKSDGSAASPSSRSLDDAIFTRLYYYGTVQMRMSADVFWLTPLGEFLDLWACHKQFLGLEKAQRVMTIDDIVPL